MCDGTQSELNEILQHVPPEKTGRPKNTAGSELSVKEKTLPMFGLIFERHVNKTDDTDLSDVIKEHISAQDD